MRNSIKVLSIVGLATLVVTSCVPKRKLDEVAAKYEAERAKAQDLHAKNIELDEQNTEKEATIADINKRIKALKNDTTIQGTSLRQLTSNYDQLNKTYRELLATKDENSKRSQKLITEYMTEIEKTRSSLQTKEDALNETQRELAEKEENLRLKLQELQKAEAEMNQKTLRIAELESEINKRDSAAKALEAKIRKALFGLEKDGLTVEMRNGKVYISLDNELLFKPGSYTADVKGKAALKKLAKALKDNDDINITVEGHTDTDKYHGGPQLKDNWDLSVMRATEIVKVLESFNVDPKRLTASGKGEHSPLDPADTKEAKKKNRRTEIIITPRLDLFEEMLKD